MAGIRKQFNLHSHSLRHKLRICFYLISVLPLLILIYLVSNYILPRFGLNFDVTTLIIVVTFISLAGFFIIKQIIDRIVQISSNVKLIADGNPVRSLEVETEDELGELSSALNAISERLNLDMDKIRDYSRQSAAIDDEIRQRAAKLSGLLHIGTMISQRASLEEIFSVCVASCRLVSDSDTSYLFLKREDVPLLIAEAVEGVNAENIRKLSIDETGGPFANLAKTAEPLIWDERRPMLKGEAIEFNKKFQLSSTLAFPIHFRGKFMGVLGIGSCKQVLYNKDEVDILKLFAKQVAIAVENDRLLRRLDELEIIDSLTGVYNAPYILTRLNEEIQRAIVYQRPCSLAIFDIDNFEEYRDRFGGLESEKMLEKIALLIKSAVSEIERVGRFSETAFAVIMPEKNKNKAIKMSDEVFRMIESAFSRISDPSHRLTVSGGISENPIDGASSEDLINVAKKRLSEAKSEGGNRVKG